jgi:hypothetical protein
MEFIQSANGKSHIPRLDSDPRIHFANWRIAVRELASLLGAAYHPTNGWMHVGILITENDNQARPFPEESQVPPLTEKNNAAFKRYKANHG